MIQRDLFQTVTSLQQDTHVNPSASQVSAKEMKILATSGRSSLELLHPNDQLGVFSKMFMVTSHWASTKCCLTWRQKATPQGRLLFQLVVSMHPIKEIEFGSSPNMWATPAAADSRGTTGGGQGKSLRTDVRMFPTPTARDYKDNGRSPAELARNSVTLATRAGGSLNPQWVEWLMGYPEGWTELKD